MALSTDNGLKTGNYINDAYGQKTETAGTEITRVVPPRTGARAKVAGIQYKTGVTAHTLTIMATLDDTLMSSEAASGQAVVALKTTPTAEDGSIIAAGDWLVLQYEDGTWAPHKVSSVSALNITVAANLAQKVLKNTTVYFMGAPGDHAERQYVIDVSDTVTLQGGDDRCVIGTASRDGSPILVLSDNATNAGKLKWVAYIYSTP